ncbi:unnamed protein product [Prorocentrum cordatum]|uniref:Peptidase M16 middle/third domain-containing protein n=1 Tax=Prorocentrum cordatum TaxID=2364126 RepID=A0ABN9QWH7_9DINO|nr:unnamed protein product [Polarella glacialis]
MSTPGARVWDYEPEQIAHLLSLLRCDRLRLVISGKAHAQRCTSAERWYGTKYSDQPLDADLAVRWGAARVVPGLALPRANPFVPQDLELRPPAGPAHTEFPERLRLGSELGSVATAYFRKDEDFGLPKAVCAFMIHCPFTAECLEHRVSVELWCAAVMEELNQFAYEAQMAGLSYSMGATATGVMVRFGGYNDKLLALLSAVARAVAEFGEVPEQTYRITRAVMERDFSNAATRAPPHVQGFVAESCTLSLTGRSHEERLAALRGPAGQLGSLRGLNRRLLDRCHVECLLQGNLTAPEAQELVHGFLRPLGIAEALDAVPPVGSAALPPGWTLLERRGADPEEKNGALVLRLQVAEHSLQSACLTALASQILSQLEGFVVQSERHPSFVLRRVREWVEGAWGYLEAELADEEFQEYRAALVAQVQERHKSLGEEFGAHWAEVAARSLRFGLRREQAACLEALGLEDLRRFVGSLRGAPALCVLVASQRGDAEPGAPGAAAESCDRVWSPEDVAAFREQARWRLRESRIDRHPGGGPVASRL